MNKDQVIASLQQSALFSDLSETQLASIADKAKVRQYFANDMIVWQGQPSTALFLILNGIVAVKHINNGEENLLAYLMSGNTFGEVGILENQVRSASVAAVSEVDVLVIRRDDFLHILHTHAQVAIQLARILGHYLVQSNRRLANENRDHKLILIFHVEEHSGGTTFSTLLADKLYEVKKTPTAYLEYPNSWRLLNEAQLNKGAQVYHHADGYDILLPQDDSYLPASTQATILLDRVRTNYDNVVIHTNDSIDDATQAFMERADLVVIMGPPTREGIQRIKSLQKKLKAQIRLEETGFVTVVNRSRKEQELLEFPDIADFELPFLADFPAFNLKARDSRELPGPLEEILNNCVERLERTNSIGIFIPTTLDVDQEADTTPYMDKTLGFMAERFGGATCKIANGVWHSEKLGLVGEVVYIVHSYITRNDLNLYLDEVVEYIKGLKKELRQEAMALEVNNKLTLI
ncbi:MAG: cyclic nucleotide-binding domain-containing protein [Bacteroidota bacterium]